MWVLTSVRCNSIHIYCDGVKVAVIMVVVKSRQQVETVGLYLRSKVPTWVSLSTYVLVL